MDRSDGSGGLDGQQPCPGLFRPAEQPVQTAELIPSNGTTQVTKCRFVPRSAEQGHVLKKFYEIFLRRASSILFLRVSPTEQLVYQRS